MIHDDIITAAALALAEAGIPAHIQEALIQGAPERGIAPRALDKAIAAAFDASRHLPLRIVLRGDFLPMGTAVEKVKGSEWSGRICGFYSTLLTPVGYCVESAAHRGSVQIYPGPALRSLDKIGGGGGREA